MSALRLRGLIHHWLVLSLSRTFTLHVSIHKSSRPPTPRLPDTAPVGGVRRFGAEAAPRHLGLLFAGSNPALALRVWFGDDTSATAPQARPFLGASKAGISCSVPRCVVQASSLWPRCPHKCTQKGVIIPQDVKMRTRQFMPLYERSGRFSAQCFCASCLTGRSTLRWERRAHVLPRGNARDSFPSNVKLLGHVGAFLRRPICP